MSRGAAYIGLLVLGVVATAAVMAALLIAGGDDDDTASEQRRPVATRTATSTPRGTPASVDDPAAAAARRQYQQMSDGQWDRHWELLHPEQRQQVPRELYVRCRATTDFEFESIQVVSVRNDPVAIGGLQRDAKAVTLRITGSIGIPGRRDTVTRTIHQVFAEGDWRWVMTEEALAAFRRGDCPGAATP